MKLFTFSNVGLVLLLMFGSCCNGVVEFDLGTPTASLENGKRKLNELMQKSNLPMGEAGSTCWKSALGNLEAGCKMMSEEIQARMAYRFTSCFHEMLGLPTYICESGTPIQSCMKQLDPSAMATFRDYFLHTQDMCYFLRQELWQEQTNSAVTRLTDAATDVTMQMEVQKMIQEQIFVSQQESLKVQSNMKKDNQDLLNSVGNVKKVFDDFSSATKEHAQVTTEIFDKLSKLQQLVAWIQGEMSLLDMLFFYFGVAVFGVVATATTRTRGARFWLILLFITAMFAERLVFSVFSDNNHLPEEVQEYRWHVRKVALVIAIFILIVEAARYRDLQLVNIDMLIHLRLGMETINKKLDDALDTQKAIDPNPASLHMHPMPPARQDDSQLLSDDDSDDTYSDYSVESIDDLSQEVRDLEEDSAENNENEQPSGSGLSKLGNYFRRKTAKSATPGTRDRTLHSYNLRERSTTPASIVNPDYVRESATEFAKAVKRKVLLKPPPATPAPPARTSYLSSDEELEN